MRPPSREIAVVAVENHAAIARDPQIVMIAVHVLAGVMPDLAAVVAFGEVHRDREQMVGVARIDDDAAVIERPLIDERVRRDELPMSAAVVRTPEDSGARFDRRVDAIGIARRDRQADPPELSGRQAVAAQRAPRLAAVNRFVKPIGVAAAGQMPRTLRRGGVRGYADR